MLTKKCNICSEVLPVDAFYQTKKSRDGYRAVCKACHNVRYSVFGSCVDCATQIRAKATRCRPCSAKKRVKVNVHAEPDELLECRTCLQAKPAKDFGVQLKSPTGRRRHCNSCLQVRAKRNKCLDCEKPVEGIRCKPCGHKARTGENHWAWRGGRMERPSDGYVLVKAYDHPNRNRGSYVLEHRLVVEQALGRYLEPHENIHHINGVKDDNRLENLELWSVMQPSGQRIEDKMDYALELIKLYGSDELRKALSSCGGPYVTDVLQRSA